MKTTITLSLLSAVAMTAAQGKGLYYVPNDTEASVPLQWSVGIDATYDDNVSPGSPATDGNESISLNPYVGLSFISLTPQTTWDVYARLGVIYYLDPPDGTDTGNSSTQATVGVNLTHRFNERLRLSSNSYLSYALEPDYSYGFSTTRLANEYLYWSTDNSLGYRWTERFATYTGFILNGLNYDNIPNSDRFTWTAYNQFRYQLSVQSVLTASYRYSETYGDGLASDSTNQFFLVGIEHRFSPNTIAILNVGAQLRDVDGINTDITSNPYVEFNLRTQVNTQFSLSSFLRYGVEDYDTVFGTTQFDEKSTLRLGIAATYKISPSLSLYGGVDLIKSSFESGRVVTTGASGLGDQDETLVNAYIGASVKLTEILTGSLTYNFTNSKSDLPNRDYDRNRITVGLSAAF